jgi:hypothetical protein
MKDKDPKQAVALIADHGLFFPWALRLAREFKEVRYWCPWDGLFPDLTRAKIGDGFEEVIRVQDFLAEAKQADIVIFPDVYNTDLLNHCRYEMGKRCWGSGDGEELELDRWRAKLLMEKMGLPSSPAKRIVGLPALRDHLRRAKDKFVKVSRYRGVGETFHHKRYALSEQWIDEKEHALGREKHVTPFMVEDGIDSACEPGWDGFVIDGEPPQESIIGYEVKDKSYFCSVLPTAEMYPGLLAINEALAPSFKKYEYRGWFSTEAKVSEGKCYPIDLTCRSASPAGETYMELIGNWGEIICHGSAGEMVEPQYEAKYGMQVVMRSAWAERDWLPVYFPEKLARWVKLYNARKIGGQICVIPQEAAHLSEIGSVVAIGDSPEECRKKIKLYADEIEGYQLEVNTDALDEAEAVADEGEKKGVKFYG